MPRFEANPAPPGGAPRPRESRSESITSRENRWLKKFRQALCAGEATEEGLIGVEGVHLVEEAFRSGLEVATLLVTPAGETHLAACTPLDGVRVLRTSEKLFAGVADTQSPQGIAALVRPREARFDDLVRGVEILPVLCGIQDPGNVGTILRSAEAFGATGAIATKGTAHPLSPKVLRASAGSALRLPVLAGGAIPVVMAQLRVAGLRLCAVSSREGASPAETDLRSPIAFLIGNEGAGLPAEAERSADLRVLIPLHPAVESLNAAVAASILFYEAARQARAASERP